MKKIIWSLLAAISLIPWPAHAAPPGASAADQIARFVQGRFISQGATLFYAAKVKGQVDAKGALALVIDADPIYSIDYLQGPYGADGKVAFYDASIAATAPCGALGSLTRLTGTEISVLKGAQFLNLPDALQGVIANPPPIDTDHRPPLNISELNLDKVRTCARSISQKITALPFEAIRIYAGDLLTEISRTTRKSTTYEYDPGDDRAVTRIEIVPKNGATDDFSVTVQAVSVMHCDYEGPHIELDHWKQGLSKPQTLAHNGQTFYVKPKDLDASAPAFPAYSQRELRRAIRKNFGDAGLASVDEAKPCAPFLRGYKFTVKYQSRVVHEIAINFPGGC